MNTIPEFVKQGFLQEYRCIYSGFEDDLDKIKGKENKINSPLHNLPNQIRH